MMIKDRSCFLNELECLRLGKRSGIYGIEMGQCHLIEGVCAVLDTLKNLLQISP